MKSDIDGLDKAGIKAVLEKGPAATKALLTRDQRDQVRTYLDKLGQLRFRCPNEAPLVTLKAEPADDPAEVGSATAPIESGAAGITLPPGVAAAVVAPVVPKKPAKAATPKTEATAPKPEGATPKVKKIDAAAPGTKTSPSAKAEPKAKPETKPTTAVAPAAAAKSPEAQSASPKPQPKVKTDDAYRPPQPVVP